MNYKKYFEAAQELEVPFTKASLMLYILQFTNDDATTIEKDLFVADIQEYKY